MSRQWDLLPQATVGRILSLGLRGLRGVAFLHDINAILSVPSG
jgi:hypothetical protein